MLHGTGANGTDRALSAAAAFQELQAEYDKFRESSNELEKELEEELSRTQKRARASEDEIWRAKEENRELKTRFTKQLLECQQELAQVREEKCSAIQMVRDKEEALEQAVENERRATAEVESLREALDDSMEVVAFIQTELEDSKTSAEEKTKQLYQALDEARAELALLTPSKGEGEVRIDRHDRICGCGSGRLSGRSESEGMLTKSAFSMSSLFEAGSSEHGKTLVSNDHEGVSPLTCRRLIPQGVKSSDSDSRNGRVLSNRVETSYAEQGRGSFLGRSFSSSTRAGAGVVMSRRSDEEMLNYGHGENANDACEIVDDNDEETRSNESDPCYGVSRGVKDAMRALSGWRPFAWCGPR